jgi:carbamoyl-phosphate synthase large subunit
MPELAVNAMLGESIQSFSRETSPIFCVKQSTFPFDRFLLDNIILGPKMRSTGETMGLDRNREFAMLKSYLGNYPDLNKKGILLFSLRENSKKILLPYLRGLIDAGYEFMATEGTAKFISKAGYACITIGKIGEKGLTLMEAIKEKNIRIVFNTPNEITFSKSDGELIRNTAISFAIPCFTRDENIKSVIECLLGTQNEELKPLALQEAKEMISGNF